MAKNWTMAEAIKAIAEQNMEDVKDIYRRFPTFAMMATRAVGGDNEAACNMIASLPEWATVNKFEKAMKNDVETTEEVVGDEQEDVAEPDEEEVVSEKTKKIEKKSAKKTKAEKPEEKAKLTGGKAYEMVKAAGKLKDMKAKGFGTKAADFIAYLEQYPIVSDEESEDEAEADEYSDKSVMDLFKECKKAGIKAAPKKDKSYYIALLKKANEDPEPDTDGDDWDEIEPEVEEKPKKAKAEKKPAKKAKPAPKAEDDEDDDEDWDI